MTISTIELPEKVSRGHSISAQRLLGALFCIFALVPWVHFGTNNLDSQPWPFIFGFIFLLFCGAVIKAPPQTLATFFLVFVGFLFSAVASESFGGFIGIRAIMNYLTFFTVYVAFYSYLDRYGFPWRIFLFMNILWLVMAGVELVAPEFVEAISHQRTTSDRGVTSLAPEPTFFAIYLFFNSWLMLAACGFQPDRKILMLVIINIVAVIVLAQSTMGVLFLLVAATVGAWYKIFPIHLTRRALRFTFFGSIALIAAIYFSGNALEESRIAKVFSFLAETSVLEILMWDASINQRVEAVVLSIHGALHNALWPAGLDTYLITRDQIIGDYGGLFWYPSQSNKIMSWMGAWIYELGVFGIAALTLLIVATHNRSRASRLSLILLGVILLSAVPLAFPLVPMLLALKASQKWALKRPNPTFRK